MKGKYWCHFLTYSPRCIDSKFQNYWQMGLLRKLHFLLGVNSLWNDGYNKNNTLYSAKLVPMCYVLHAKRSTCFAIQQKGNRFCEMYAMKAEKESQTCLKCINGFFRLANISENMRPRKWNSLRKYGLNRWPRSWVVACRTTIGLHPVRRLESRRVRRLLMGGCRGSWSQVSVRAPAKFMSEASDHESFDVHCRVCWRADVKW